MAKRKIEIRQMTQADAERMTDEEYECFVDEQCAQTGAALGAEVKAWRKRHGWTQAQLAIELDLPSGQSYVSKIEAGKKSPPAYILLALDAIEFRDVIEREKAKRSKK